MNLIFTIVGMFSLNFIASAADAVASANPYYASKPINTTKVSFNQESTALFGDKAVAEGYDVVAYFDNKAIKGNENIQSIHKGALFRFSSAENQKKFLTNPDMYLPAFGGYCAYAISKGYLAPIDPEAFTIYQGKLYLNYDKSIRTKWLQDVDANIIKAEANWPKLSQNAPATKAYIKPSAPFF